MTKLNIYAMMKNTATPEDCKIRIWDLDSYDCPMYNGPISGCPKEYLHRQVTDWSISTDYVVFYF